MTTGRRYRVMAQTLAELAVMGLNAPDLISGGRDKGRAVARAYGVGENREFVFQLTHAAGADRIIINPINALCAVACSEPPPW